MKKIYLLLILPLVLGSCTKFLDVNEDPNNPVTVTPDLSLPVAQVYTASYIQGNRRLNHLGNMMMYNWSETYGFSWYDEEFKYNVTSTFYAALFDNAYSSPLKEYGGLDDLGDEYVNYKAISKIMKSYHFQILVDLYGDIPYFDALGRGALPTPKYDDAAAIYADLLVQLDEAIAMIKEAEDNPVAEDVSGDVMFDGNMDSWIKFANTVKVRILTRAANTLDVAAGLAAIEAEGSGFITDNVVVNPGYLKEEGKQNPFYAAFGWGVDGTVRLTNDATCATQYILELLSNNRDPRIDYIYENPENLAEGNVQGHLGVNQGQYVEDDYGADFVSNIGPGLLIDDTQGAVIFTYAEHNFNMAELALAGHNMGASAKELYEMGIKASFLYLGLGSDDAEDYYSQNLQNVNYDVSGNKLEAIITQKWFALNGINAEQSWFDYSRTGYPSNLPVSELATTSDRPVRLLYPASEISANNANVPKQNQSIAFSNKIFWAQ